MDNTSRQLPNRCDFFCATTIFSGLIYLNPIFSRQPSAVGYKTKGMGTCRAKANTYTGLIYLNQVSHTQERKAT